MRMRVTISSNRVLLRRLALGCALACLAGVAAPSTARADDDSFLSTVMHGLGLRNGSEPTIDYRERSPLVVPPRRDLPAPERASVENNPAWPVDPELKAKKEKDELEKLSKGSDAFDEQARVLRPDQMTPGRKFSRTSRRTSTVSRNANSGASDNDIGRVLKPSELGYSGGLFGMFKTTNNGGAEIGKFTSEPPRASLTEPPAGYQTPSPAAPYGLGKDLTPIKPTDYKVEHGTQQN
ncbi:MAG: hypothetical protein ACR2K5_08600 [Pseudolabrys sp.]